MVPVMLPGHFDAGSSVVENQAGALGMNRLGIP